MSLIGQYVEKLADFKKDLSSVHDALVSLDLEQDNELFAMHSQLEQLHFTCSHTARRLLNFQILQIEKW